jgi:GTP cyclohydrolase I
MMNLKLMQDGIAMLLDGMGIDLQDPNFVDTPRRVARMYSEMLSPQENNWATFPAKRTDMIILRSHRIVAICPHHLQPAELSCCIGYIPHKLVLGLSKLARVAEEQLVRPVLQEDLTDAIADALEQRLDPKGIGVVLTGVHGCIRFRGVESQGDVVTSAMRGVLLLNPAARSEFLQLIGRP